MPVPPPTPPPHPSLPQQKTGAAAVSDCMLSQRPEERALGDVLIPEETPGLGDGGGIGISAEPPGFLKRLFSVPKNVRKTAKAGDVVVPVIGARDGWGGIRQASLSLHVYTMFSLLLRGKGGPSAGNNACSLWLRGKMNPVDLFLTESSSTTCPSLQCAQHEA